MRVPAFLIGLFLACLAAAPVESQEVTGGLEGLVLTADRQPLPEVRVTVSGPALQGERTGLTDSRGYFRFLALPIGNYIVRLRRIGLREVHYEDVRIRLGRTTSLSDIRMEAQAVELGPIVTRGDAVLIDYTSTAIGANLSAEIFQNLPIERDYRSIVKLLPHANESFYGDEANIGGSTGTENVYFIDGVNVTDSHRGVTGTDLPYNFIREIEVKQGGYQAEYGRAHGGIVNVITHSGSNDFRVGGFGFFTNSTFAGDPTPGLLDLNVDAFSTYDVGVSLSGPLVRDRLWFFSAYNPSFERQDVEIPGFGFFQDRVTSHRFAGKLTWRAASTFDVELSTFGDPTTANLVGRNLFQTFLGSPVGLGNADPFLAVTKEGGFTVSLRGRAALGERALIEGSLARFQRDEDERGATERGSMEPLFQDVTTGVWSGGAGATKNTRTVRTSVSLAATFLLGRHTVKVGSAFEDNYLDHSWITPEPGVIFAAPPTFYQTLFFGQLYEARGRVPTFYAQDAWRVSNRLQVNAGLRWDGQYFIAAGDTVAQSITDQWQPRVGFTFQPGRLGEQKIFGSYGRYYLQLPLNILADVFSGWRNDVCIFSADPRDAAVQPDFCPFSRPADGPANAGVEDLVGEHFDEFTAGYERKLGDQVKLGIRGMHRILGGVVAAAFRPETNQGVFGNIGKGTLSFLPEPKRTYTALEFTIERVGSPLHLQASYVLSRTYGNYSGGYNLTQGFAFPGVPTELEVLEQTVNSTGLLSNDRTHVFKLFGSYAFDVGLTAGTFFTVQSGTPLNEFGSSTFIFRPIFLVERGSAGRTPTIWDLNIRLVYDLARASSLRGRVVVDVQHIGSPRTTVFTDQFRFIDPSFDPTQFSLDAETRWQELVALQAAANPNFGAALGHQPPMTVRLGYEVEF